jgi:hypothetical protein
MIIYRIPVGRNDSNHVGASVRHNTGPPVMRTATGVTGGGGGDWEGRDFLAGDHELIRSADVLLLVPCTNSTTIAELIGELLQRW